MLPTGSPATNCSWMNPEPEARHARKSDASANGVTRSVATSAETPPATLVRRTEYRPASDGCALATISTLPLFSGKGTPSLNHRNSGVEARSLANDTVSSVWAPTFTTGANGTDVTTL